MASAPRVTLRTLLTVLALLGTWPASAQAYCRTYTCLSDDSDDVCEIVDGCPVGGKPVRWPSGCVAFAVQRDGSSLRDLAAPDVLNVAEAAFAIWTDSECHRGGSPPFTFVQQGEVSCRQPEYNCDPTDWNTNVIMFQDEGWPHASAALAITCVTMNLDTGEILDADIELNTPGFDFALPGDPHGADLRTVLTHEVGHVLGLDHPNIPGTVMHATYDHTTLISSLSDDDLAGICDIYGGKDSDPRCKLPELPQATECVGESPCRPVSGDAGGCSCRAGAPAGGKGGPLIVALFALAGAASLRRRAPDARDQEIESRYRCYRRLSRLE